MSKQELKSKKEVLTDDTTELTTTQEELGSVEGTLTDTTLQMNEGDEPIIEDLGETSPGTGMQVAENDEFQYIEKVSVSHEKHKARLKEDFSWIGDLKLTKVDDQYTLQDPAGSYIISDTRLTETQFVQRWLDQFALGYVGPTNYFDATNWGKLTNGHQRGVIVTTDEGEPMFVIPPLSRAQFTPEEQYVLDLAHKSYTNASSAEQTGDSHRAQEIISSTSNLIKQHVSEDAVTITDLVPGWFYKKYNVVPYIKRSMLYCRDMYGLNPAIVADWEMAEGVFVDIHNKRKLSKYQLEFMDILTHGEFTPPAYDPVEDNGKDSLNDPSNSEDFDPFDN